MRDKEKDEAEKAVRKRIAMESAFRLFSERGIEAVTMPDIARDSGVARPSLYRYFSSKVDLAMAVGAWKWEEYIAWHDSTLTPEDIAHMSAAEYLEWYLDAFVDLYHNHADMLRLNYYLNGFLRNEGVTIEQKMPIVQVVEGLKENFHVLYEKGAVDGTIRTDLSEETMLSTMFHVMLATVTRYAVGLVYEPEGLFDAEREIELLRHALLHELTTGAA